MKIKKTNNNLHIKKMKKNLFLVAIAAFALCLASCQKETINPVNNNTVNDGEINSNARVKTTSDLRNTDWTCSLTLNQLLYVMGADTASMPAMGDASFDMGLNFNESLAHFTFPENIEAFGLDADQIGMTQIFGLSYQYSYDGSSHTGYLVCNAEDATGNIAPAQLQFTYDDATDIITFNIEIHYATDNPDDVEESNPIVFPLNFVRNE